MLDPRQSRVLTLLRAFGPLSRWELHERTRLRPNTVGALVADMIETGLIRESDGQAIGNESTAGGGGPGRPRVPLEIDPHTRTVVGLALQREEVSLCVLNLLGQPVAPPTRRRVRRVDHVGAACRSLYQAAGHSNPVAVGVSVPGLIDPQMHSILLSSASASRQSTIKLDPIYDAVGDTPLLLDNDMHALAAQWVLTQPRPPREDVLLVHVQDGALGSAMLVDGRPNHGCVVGANELGHTRFFVDTELCFCGQRGCLERICSSAFLRAKGMPTGRTLAETVRDFPGGDAPAMRTVLRYLAAGLANAVNFMRPARLILTGPILRPSAFTTALSESIRGLLLAGLTERIEIELWDESPVGYGEAAAWLALAPIYLPEWAA